ncbi:hypothetical protein H9P43_000318 [Blastocladiella emersonii ATCC 22665]|nr:hypothetical protein H9P43_000318 [Blastocladiella emersonii ATCC 22665]
MQVGRADKWSIVRGELGPGQQPLPSITHIVSVVALALRHANSDAARIGGFAAVFPLPDGYDTATRFAAECRAAANGVMDDDMGHIAAAELPPGPLSSTRAETHAFVLAVSQVPAGTALHIYSDSQDAIEATIKAARTQLSPTATVRQRVRCASSDLCHADNRTTPDKVVGRAATAAANLPSDAHEICGDPRNFTCDLAQAECRYAVIAEDMAHLKLAQPPLAECAPLENPEDRCPACWDANFKPFRCSCGLLDTPFHWFQCTTTDEQRINTLDQIAESTTPHWSPAAGALVDALLGPDLLHAVHLDINTLRADRDASFAAPVAGLTD